MMHDDRTENQSARFLAQLFVATLPIVFLAALFRYMRRAMSNRAVPFRPRELSTVSTPQAPKAVGPYAQAVSSGDLVFCSGQVGLYPGTGQLVGGGIREETRRALDNLSAVLGAAGSDLDHVVKTTVYLTSIGEFKDMNEVYAETFKGRTPARATVEVSRLPLGAKVEIECVAIRAR